MKKILKLVILSTLILIFSLITFFIWASSPQYSEDTYNQLINYENPTRKRNDQDSIYTVVTYNIGYLSGMTNNRAVEKPKSLFEDNLNKAKQHFDSLQVDFIAFQEIDYHSARSYRINQQEKIASLGYPFSAQAVNWDETYVPFPYWPPTLHFGEMLSGQSILSKHPVKASKRVVLERVADAPFYRDRLYLERLAQIVEIEIENKILVLINVHLEAFDKPTRINQFNYVYELFQKYAVQYPTILLGDFNSSATDNDAVIQKLIKLESIGNAAFDKNNISNTFDSRMPFKRIDYIFYTKNSIEYLDGKVLTAFGEISDHLPVFMKFKLK